jgi:hypothetical protein
MEEGDEMLQNVDPISNFFFAVIGRSLKMLHHRVFWVRDFGKGLTSKAVQMQQQKGSRTWKSSPMTKSFGD